VKKTKKRRVKRAERTWARQGPTRKKRQGISTKRTKRKCETTWVKIAGYSCAKKTRIQLSALRERVTATAPREKKKKEETQQNENRVLSTTTEIDRVNVAKVATAGLEGDS